MFCKNCGNELKNNESFCPFCGAAAHAPQPSEAPVAAPTPAPITEAPPPPAPTVAAQEAPAYTQPADNINGFTPAQAAGAPIATPSAKKNKNKLFGILAVAAVALIVLIIVLIVSFGNKSTFGSEEEMQIYLEGVWESHTYEKTLYLVFHDGKLWDVYDAPYDLVKSAEKYKEPTYENAVASVMWEWPKYEPGKGKISQRGDYPIYIMKNGTLKQRKAVYVKSGDSVLRFESFISAFNSAWKKEHPEQKEAADSTSDKSNTQTTEYQAKEPNKETTKPFQPGTVICTGMGAYHKLYYRSGNTSHVISSCVVTGFDYEWIGNQLSLFFDIEKKEDINGKTGNSPCRFMIVIYQGGEIVYSNSMLTQGMVPGQKDNYGERVSTTLDCTKNYRVVLSDYLI